MALYAIGDIQGCHAEFCQLLDLIAFSPASDRLWLVGDLVNRGPESLAVLREVRKLGDAATTVLGNHDFHLLTVAAGHRRPHRSDTLDAILDAPFSIVLDEAENRKHFQKALLLALIGIDGLPADPELQPIARALLR